MGDLLARTYSFMAELEVAAARALPAERWRIVLDHQSIKLVVADRASDMSRLDEQHTGGYYFTRATIEETPLEWQERIIRDAVRKVAEAVR